ncbi:hypothetical protein [Burkholderia sp. PAMC 26561]|uniref:hypothetical protein n=1 Tax=Burkholderia sp. PAMC 26561 TaxID=1795043 RepID=UPI000AF532D9|nr:hypothetical protein [Burkholderia sp. PAMC 26561]
MNDLGAALFEQFSHPGAKVSEGLFACIAGAYANVAIAETIVEPLPVKFHDIDGQLDAALNAWIERDKSLGDVWRLSLAKLGRSVLERNKEDQAECLGRTCLDIASQLDGFTIRFSASSGLPLCVAGYVFRPSETIFARKSGEILELWFGGPSPRRRSRWARRPSAAPFSFRKHPDYSYRQHGRRHL